MILDFRPNISFILIFYRLFRYLPLKIDFMLQINRTSEEQEVNLKPSQVVLHVVLKEGSIDVDRGAQNRPPANPDEAKVEMDNWFTLASNCLARIIGVQERVGGISHEVLIQKALQIINDHLETGKIISEKRIIIIDQPQTTILHMILQPETGEFDMFRSKSKRAPTTPQEEREEIEDTFTLLCYVVARIISVCRAHGIPPEMMIATTSRVINEYLNSGGSGGHRKKIVLELNKPNTELAKS
jgi:ferric iron reductase protein FhuF